MYNEDDVQVDGYRVLVKEKPGERFSHWKCIAQFHSHKGCKVNPADAARKFAASITK